ncbi:hypothetical protein FS749_006333 [Ceratobasidium sp. UAMH 11750]|nr:hypothetical protein FS749_006333 [Ceratobasidium sp. UAMH 11750]
MFQRSKYAEHLQALANQQEKISTGRPEKKRKREGTTAPRTQAANNGSTSKTRPTPSNTHSAAPGLPSGLSQNINRSENGGRQAREEFVSKTLNSATSTAEGASHQNIPQPPAPTNNDDPSDAEMANRSNSDDDGDGNSNSDDDTQGETPRETACLKQLKDLYSKHPDKTTQKALLTVLQELSCKAKEEERWKKHGKRRSNRDAPWDQDGEYVCTDTPWHREKQRVALSGYIRLILGQLLGLKDKKSLLPHGPPPEVATPTAAAFYVKWDESEKSEFNATAARIVALKVVADYPSLCELDEMHDMVTCHIKYLRARYRRQTDPRYIAQESQRLLLSSAGTRKRTLYYHRLRIINAIPALAQHGRLIEMLGLEGMSSDEEDRTRDVRGIYVIKRRKQLSSQVNHLKRQLDLVYSIHFKGPGSKGNQLRKRVDTGLVSKRRFKVPSLPLSCMDPGWLATLTDVQRGMYEFCDMKYDFSFPEELLQPPEGF